MDRGPVRKTAKLADVARLARVSTATVSRALTQPDKVKAATAARIRQAVQALGYVAHGAARALASRRTHTIGAVIPTLDNAIFANTAHALQKALDDAGYTLLLACHEFDAGVEARVTEALIERGVDGLVLLGATHHASVFQMIDTHQIPYILTWALDAAGRHPCVGFDNRAAAVRIARHLLDLGHREFAMISGVTSGNERAAERLEGVRQALAARGLGDTIVPRAAFGRRYARALHAASFAEPLYDTFAFIARHDAPLSPAVRAFVAIVERRLGTEAEPMLYAGGPSEADG